MQNNLIKIGVALKWRGVYGDTVTYYRENLVTLCGSVFRCKPDEVAGVPPLQADEQGHMSYVNPDTWDVIVDNVGVYNRVLDAINLQSIIEQFPEIMKMLGLRVVLTSYLNGIIGTGETDTLIATVYKDFVNVTASVTQWGIVRDTGDTVEDEVWNASDKARAFAGTIEITEADLSETQSMTKFTVTAHYSDGVEEAVLTQSISM